MIRWKWVAFIFTLIVLAIYWNYPNTEVNELHSDVQDSSGSNQIENDQRSEQTISLVADEEDATLLESIKKEAKDRAIPAIDAKVDPVWKAIPGYDGLEVDVEQTYKRSKGKDHIEWVYRDVKPRIMLEDLGAQPVYRGNPKKEIASLMINVAWGTEYIPSMLETLREANVYATFFLDGSWLEDHEEIAKQIVDEGHEIGNHAYSHPNISELSRKEATDEIVRTQQLIKEKLGVTPRFFAPPSGDYDEETVQIAHELGLTTVLWTLDTVDWKKPSASSIVQKVTARVESGTLILMHPTESTSKALPELIQNIKNKGLVIDTVKETLSSNRLEKVESMLLF